MKSSLKPTRINAWLWVGGTPRPKDLKRLAAKKGVVLDINTTADPDMGVPTGMDVLTIGWQSDDQRVKPVADFQTAITRIVKRLGPNPSTASPPKSVLIHCQAGVNRGPMMATVVLAYFTGLTAKQAWKKVRKKRPQSSAWQVPAYKKSIKQALKALRGKKATA